MFYLVSRKDDRIIGSHASTEGFYTNGAQVVSVPQDVAVDETNRSGVGDTFVLSDLLDQKYDGVLEKIPVLFAMDYHETGTIFDTTHSDFRGAVGGSTAWMPPQNGALVTSPLNVPKPHDRFAVYWDLYTLERDVEGTSSSVRYVPLSPYHTGIEVYLSNDGGTSFVQVWHNYIVEMSAIGADAIIRFENNGPDRVYVGGFSLMYPSVF